MIFHRKVWRIKPSTSKLEYNAAIYRYGDEWRMVSRCQNTLRKPSWLELSTLDPKDFTVATRLKLDLPVPTLEDPRVTVVGDKTYVFFNSGGGGHWDGTTDPDPTDYTINVACLGNNNKCEYIKPLTFANRRMVEKNWQMFYHASKWKCIYSVEPWQMLEFDDNWNGTLVIREDLKLPWYWGQIRGGNNPIAVGPKMGIFGAGQAIPHLVAFFHSTWQPPIHKMTKQYVAGMLQIDLDTLLPTGISRYPLIEPNPKDKSAVACSVCFPSGAVYDRGRFVISYGYNDREVRIEELDRDEIEHVSNFMSLTKDGTRREEVSGEYYVHM